MRLRPVLVLLLCIAPLLACRTQEQASAKPSSRPATHDLSLDESRGGHTLQRHIGRNDEQLRQRLQAERNISAASSYTDRATAEHAIGAALDQNADRIQRWMQRGERRPNLVLDYSEPNEPLGRVMFRGAMGSVPCDHSIVVLKADGPSDYFVLTSYPECRP